MKELKDVKKISNWRGRLEDVPFWDQELLRRGGGLAEWMMSPHMEKCDTLNDLLLGLWPSLRIGESLLFIYLYFSFLIFFFSFYFIHLFFYIFFVFFRVWKSLEKIFEKFPERIFGN